MEVASNARNIYNERKDGDDVAVVATTPNRTAESRILGSSCLFVCSLKARVTATKRMFGLVKILSR